MSAGIKKIVAPISKKEEFPSKGLVFFKMSAPNPVTHTVAARLKALQREFKDGDEFIERLVDASFDHRKPEGKQPPIRQKRTSYLQALKAHETHPNDFDFDSLQQDRLEIEREMKANRRGKSRAPKTFFDLLNMLAEGKLRDADRVPQEFPEWLLRGLTSLRADDEEEHDGTKEGANESEERDVEEREDVNEEEEREDVNEEEEQDGVREVETEYDRADENEDEDRETEADYDRYNTNESEDQEKEADYDNTNESEDQEKEAEYGHTTNQDRGKGAEYQEEDDDKNESEERETEDLKEPDVWENDGENWEEPEIAREATRAAVPRTREVRPTVDHLEGLLDRLEAAREQDEEDGEDDEDDEGDEGGSPNSPFTSVGAREGRVSVGARSFELDPAQRVALHFATPGDSSRETMLRFIKMLQPGNNSEATAALDVSDLREYAYDLWLAQTDDDLFALADKFSGNTGIIHPVIQQELEDTVRKYQQQLKDVNDNGKLAVQKLKARASTLPRAEQLKFETCLKEVERALNQNEVLDKTQCTQINPAEKVSNAALQDMLRKPTKWLIRDPTNLNQATFLTEMSPAELQKFGNYLVSQSAVGNCRMSEYLQSLAATCEKDIQQTKDAGIVPDVDKIETLRFIEWVLRRPVKPKNDTSVPLWLLRYPYVEGPQMEGKLPLSAKYRNFNPQTANENLLASIFKATNKQNIRIMKMAYNKRFTEAF